MFESKNLTESSSFSKLHGWVEQPEVLLICAPEEEQKHAKQKRIEGRVGKETVKDRVCHRREDKEYKQPIKDLGK